MESLGHNQGVVSSSSPGAGTTRTSDNSIFDRVRQIAAPVSIHDRLVMYADTTINYVVPSKVTSVPVLPVVTTVTGRPGPAVYSETQRT